MEELVPLVGPLTREQFYDEDHPTGLARLASPEVDFGGWWSWSSMGRDYYRASWITHTGEFYVAAHRGETFWIIGVEPDVELLRERLSGWAVAVFEDQGVEWLIERFA